MRKISPDDVVLGLLAKRPTHGYDLLNHFRQPARLEPVWHLNTSQLYTILRRLENGGDIEGREVFSPDAPPRTVYWLSEQGQTRLHDWLHDAQPSASTRHIRTAFISRLYIAHQLQRPRAPIIQAQIDACQARLCTLQDKLAQTPPGVGHLSVSLVVNELAAIIDWLGHCNTTGWPLELDTDHPTQHGESPG